MSKFFNKSAVLLFALLLVCLSCTACFGIDQEQDNSDPIEDGDGMLQGAPNPVVEEEDTEKDEEYITEDEKSGLAAGNLGNAGKIVNTYDGYLGYGYNMISSAYYNHRDVNTTRPVVNIDSLAKENHVYVINESHYADPHVIIANSTKDYSEKISAKASLGGKFPLSGSFNTNFEIDKNYQMTSNQRLITLQANLETRMDYINESSPELLAEHAANGFKKSVETLYKDPSAEKIKSFINSYGTHVLTNVTMGGRFDLNYVYNNKSKLETEDIKTMVKASYKYVQGRSSVEIENAKKEFDENSDLKVITYGGSVTVDPFSIDSAMMSYKDWSQQVQDGIVNLVDSSEVIPIWEIIEKLDEIYSSLSQEVEEYCEKERVNTINAFRDTKGVTDPSKSYISDIYIGYGDSPIEAKGMLYNKGVDNVNIVPLDLNQGAGGKFIYLGYKKTTSKENPITHILADYYSKEQSSNITSNGIEMKIIDVDLNKGASGKFIYLYYTRDKKAGEPLTDIKYLTENDIEEKGIVGYNGLRCYTTGELMDLNTGTSGDLIYLWFKRN